MNLEYKTKGASLPGKKPRVFFTCHPDDFDRTFGKICDDIFKTHDCAVYYTKDMSEKISDEDMETDIGRMNLFVIPVTYKLLTKPCRAMENDFVFAKSRNIPVLPIVFESEIDSIYSQSDKFGERQYINPFAKDITAIKYEDKLKKYLDSVLISDETAKRIRNAFDAYIFLSYRKKDRRYANELMRLIHEKKQFRDIAIWYDEFLAIGESFRENIEKMMDDSELFALLVTPNLLEEPDGKPNFVMGKEYPGAKEKGMDIIPAEMQPTDQKKLGEKFKDIPECVNPYSKDFEQRLLQSLERIAKSANDDDAEHNFLIGLAYLDGIDVEVNSERGIELITSAANADLPEAIKKLCNMYKEGVGVRLDYNKSLEWAQRLYKSCVARSGEEDAESLSALSALAEAYYYVGNTGEFLSLCEKAYLLKCKVLGEKHPDTLRALNDLALSCGESGNYRKALKLSEKAYNQRREVLGEEHYDTIISFGNYAMINCSVGNIKKFHELYKEVYELVCKFFGEEHTETLTALNNLAFSYSKIGDSEKFAELMEKAYKCSCKILGPEHPYSIRFLNNLALAYKEIGEKRKALKRNAETYELCCKVFGEEHPNTLISLENLSISYEDCGSIRKALKLNRKTYELNCKMRGEEHPATLNSLSNLAYGYYRVKKYNESVQLGEKAYEARRRRIGADHPDTLITLSNLADSYRGNGDYGKALELYKKEYKSMCKKSGMEHPDLVMVLSDIAYCYGKIGDNAKHIEFLGKRYELACNVYGKYCRSNLLVLIRLIICYCKAGNSKKLYETLLKFYSSLLPTLFMRKK